MIVLAFDPGSRWTGWAVVETGEPVRHIASGQQRSATLKESIAFTAAMAMVADWPDVAVVAIEKSFAPKRNALAWEETAQVRGAVKAAAPPGVEIVELTARQVRAKLGIGPLTRLKSSTRYSVRPLRGLTADARIKVCIEKLFNIKTAGSHECDALALAYAVAAGRGTGHVNQQGGER